MRCTSAESLLAAIQTWEPLVKAPIIGVLTPGCRPPSDRTCLVEPYDRDDLMRLLPQPVAATRCHGGMRVLLTGIDAAGADTAAFFPVTSLEIAR